ncbi:MAG TPA: phosphate ABC transporter substrate-binding protein [Mobilitalea sp.]|nr:phosphate ABC transporter substrate-binding protein [Mobilitalea sp.]
MKSIKRIAVFMTMLFMLTSVFTACSKSNNDTQSSDNTTAGTTDNTTTDSTTTDSTTTDTTATDGTTTDTSADLSGTVTMAGSTSMEKIANAAAEAFMGKYPNVTVTAEFTGSGAGIESVTNGTVNIGNSSRNLTDAEKAGGLVENIIAIDGIAIVVDTKNTVANLTKDQLAQIYKGEVTNWKDLGGSDQPIVVIGRESGSGTRDAFEELVGVKDACKYSNEINSTGGVMAKVASTPGSIGYVSLDVVDDTVNEVSVDSIQPTEENIISRTYLLSRPFVMATKGEISAQSETVQAFFAYLQSTEGKDLIKSVGLFLPN